MQLYMSSTQTTESGGTDILIFWRFLLIVIGLLWEVAARPLWMIVAGGYSRSRLWKRN